MPERANHRAAVLEEAVQALVTAGGLATKIAVGTMNGLPGERGGVEADGGSKLSRYRNAVGHLVRGP